MVAVCWGVNFPATTIALQHFPPLLMVALRFTLIAVPTMILVPRPQVPTRWLVGTGLGMGTMQFALLYVAVAPRADPPATRNAAQPPEDRSGEATPRRGCSCRPPMCH